MFFYNRFGFVIGVLNYCSGLRFDGLLSRDLSTLNFFEGEQVDRAISFLRCNS